MQNIFTLDFYNRNWLLDVVTPTLGIKKMTSWVLKDSDFVGWRVLCIFIYIYLYIDVAFVLMALIELLKITLIIIEKCKRH